MIRIERDNKLLFVVFVLINTFLFLMILIANQFFELQLVFLEKVMFVVVVSCWCFLFLKVTVLIKNSTIYFKNIYGITMKRIDLRDVKGKKVIYGTLPYKSFLFFFGSKYDKLIQVKLDLKN